MIPVKLLAIDLRPSGHTHATFRAPDGRRVQWVFAPGQFNDLNLARTMRLIQHKRAQEASSDRHV